MSRSNGSQPLPAGQAPQAGGYDVNPDPRAWTAPQNAGHHNGVPPATAQPSGQYQGQPHYQHARPAADQGYVSAPYADPYAQHGGYYQTPGQQAYSNPAAPAAASLTNQTKAASYTPQFDPYVAPAYQPVAPQASAAANTYPDLRGAAYEHPAFDRWPTQTPADPRGYDLASYGTQPQHNGATHAQASRQTAAPVDWGQTQPANHAQPAAYDSYQQPQQNHADQNYTGQNYAGQNYAGQNYAGEGQAARQQHDYGLGTAQSDQMTGTLNEQYAGNGEGMEEEAPRGRRGLLIAATLAGAIFVGGGLTLAYNSLLGSGSGGPPPLVKSAEGPTKVKPSDPGGKQFAHADSKVLGRLNDSGASSDVDAAGSKKVSTLVVKPDGSIEPPAVAEAAPIQTATVTPAPASVATVPGLSVISVGGAQAAAPAVPSPLDKAIAPAVSEAKQAVQTLAAAPQKPLVVNPPAAPQKAPAPVALAADSAGDATGGSLPMLVKKAPPVKKVATAASAASAAASAAPVTGSGYMAVVASVPASAKSRMDALTQWADMQQKYGSILQGKTMDVQEAKVGDKGLYHRLLVGPPGSKDQANSICSQLKTAGHTDCWVMGN